MQADAPPPAPAGAEAMETEAAAGGFRSSSSSSAGRAASGPPAPDRRAAAQAPIKPVLQSSGLASGASTARAAASTSPAPADSHSQRLAEALTGLLKPLRLVGNMDLRGVDEPRSVHACRRVDGAHRQEVFYIRVEEKPEPPPPKGVRIGGGYYVSGTSQADRVRALAAEREVSQERPVSPMSLGLDDDVPDTYGHGKPSAVTTKYSHGAYVRGIGRQGQIGDRRQDKSAYAKYDYSATGSAKEGMDGTFRVLSSERQRARRMQEAEPTPSVQKELDTTRTVKGPASEALNALLVTLGLSADGEDSKPMVHRTRCSVDGKWSVELCYVCADKNVPDKVVEQVFPPAKLTSTAATQTDKTWCSLNTRVRDSETMTKWPYRADSSCQTEEMQDDGQRPAPETADSCCQASPCAHCGGLGHTESDCPFNVNLPQPQPVTAQVQGPCRVGGGFLVGEPIPGLEACDKQSARAAVAKALLERRAADDTDSSEGRRGRRPRPSSAPSGGRAVGSGYRLPNGKYKDVKGMVPNQGPEFFIALEREREELKKRIRGGSGNNLDGNAGFVMGTYDSLGKKWAGPGSGKMHTPFRVFRSRVTAESAVDLETASSPRPSSGVRTHSPGLETGRSSRTFGSWPGSAAASARQSSAPPKPGGADDSFMSTAAPSAHSSVMKPSARSSVRGSRPASAQRSRPASAQRARRDANQDHHQATESLGELLHEFHGAASEDTTQQRWRPGDSQADSPEPPVQTAGAPAPPAPAPLASAPPVQAEQPSSAAVDVSWPDSLEATVPLTTSAVNDSLVSGAEPAL